ncbi:dTDP-glucose 4,6-dehydratase 2 [subsurface metagenome]|jgi:dTDP-glucose 4,6-dehydratase
MKTYLVTGGAGFIGCNFIKYMFNKYNNGIKIINLDKLTYSGNLANLKDVENRENYIFIKADICDSKAIDTIFKKYHPDYVVNFAAESHVDRSIEDPSIFVKTNVLGTQVLLNAALKNRIKRFLQISTDEVYGSLGEEGYFTEETPLNAHSPYSASKAAADMIAKAYYDTYSLPVNVTRCSNNYGPYQFPEKLIPLMINNCLHKNSLPVYGNGKNIRDWLYVEDHCQAIDLIISKAKPGKIYNIGGNNEMRNIDIVKIIIRTLREITKYEDISEDLITFVEDRKGHDWRYAIDSSLLKKELGWQSNIKFKDGIKLTIKWYLDNLNWMKEITLGEYKNYYRKFYGNRKLINGE